MKTNYKSTEWTNKLTMPDGIDNPEWDNIAEQIELCNDLAAKLQAGLHDLAEMMFLNDCYLNDGDVVADEIDNYAIEDYAAQVEEIMNATDLIYE